MQEITIGEIMGKAKELQEQGKKWHFHMLTPDCMFNESGKNAFVLENESDSESYVVYSDKRYMEQGQVLVRMLHGKEILGKKEIRKGESREVKEILERARDYNSGGVHWHHHMLFPNCIYNKHRGKWCIVFEDKEKNRIIESVTDYEPSESLRKIEVLFYAQKG
ncbi:MAG: hypothetical protein JSV92_01305 [archaeon]|nr:MAG: hypothetical protein JSV92_01305 [archaeon]